MSSRSGVATLRTAIHSYLLTTYLPIQCMHAIRPNNALGSYLKFSEKLSTPHRSGVGRPINWSDGLGNTISQTVERSAELDLVRICSTHAHAHPFNGPFSGTTWVSRYQKGKTNLDSTEARDSEWQWHQLGHMQVCTSLQTDNHASTPPLSFLQAGCPSCRPTNIVKALKALLCQSLTRK